MSGSAERRDSAHRSQRRALLLQSGAVAAVFAVVLGLWSLATPLWTTPDAPSHDLTAYAFGHGHLDPKTTTDYVNGVNTNALTPVPSGIVRSALTSGCYAFKAQVPASCIRPVGPGKKEVPFVNSAARNFPVYYTVVGLASNVGSNAQALYFQRLAAVVLAALFLGWAGTALLGLRRPGVAITGLLLAVTPMVAYLGGAVNPNTIEIMAAIAMAACSMAFFAAVDDPWRRGVMLRRASIAATVVASTRILGPLWVGVWVLALLIIFGWRTLRDPWASRQRWWLIGPPLGAVANMVWLKHSGVDNIRNQPLFDLSLAERLRSSADEVNGSLSQMVGSFGWLDTPLPVNLVLAYAMLLMFVLGTLWAGLRLRHVGAAVMVAALSWVLPVVLQAWKWNLQGPVWQGRYILPTACLVPVVIAAAAAHSERLDAGWNTVTVRWSRLGALAGLAVLHMWAFLVLLRRNVHGLTVPGQPKSGFLPWQPPGLGPTALVLCLLTVMVVGLVLVARPMLSSSEGDRA